MPSFSHALFRYFLLCLIPYIVEAACNKASTTALSSTSDDTSSLTSGANVATIGSISPISSITAAESAISTSTTTAFVTNSISFSGTSVNSTPSTSVTISLIETSLSSSSSSFDSILSTSTIPEITTTSASFSTSSHDSTFITSTTTELAANSLSSSASSPDTTLTTSTTTEPGADVSSYSSNGLDSTISTIPTASFTSSPSSSIITTSIMTGTATMSLLSSGVSDSSTSSTGVPPASVSTLQLQASGAGQSASGYISTANGHLLEGLSYPGTALGFNTGQANALPFTLWYDSDTEHLLLGTLVLCTTWYERYEQIVLDPTGVVFCTADDLLDPDGYTLPLTCTITNSVLSCGLNIPGAGTWSSMQVISQGNSLSIGSVVNSHFSPITLNVIAIS
ncbi:hypothetical protein BX600DRAFT_541084 [Xylariales sp. PMI_506]|nr:hypothetical protein BX600DRAFT_541084 [Xylariales sp. PMI_506]